MPAGQLLPIIRRINCNLLSLAYYRHRRASFKESIIYEHFFLVIYTPASETSAVKRIGLFHLGTLKTTRSGPFNVS